MRKLLNQYLYLKLVLALTLLMTVAGAGSGIFISFQIKQQLHGQLIEKSDFTALSLERALAPLIENQAMQDVQSLIETTGAYRFIRTLHLIDRTNTIQASSDLLRVKENLKISIVREVFDHAMLKKVADSDNIFSIAYPIRTSSYHPGSMNDVSHVLYICMDKSYQNTILNTLRTTLLLMVVIIFICTCLAGIYLIHVILMRPLKKLTRAIDSGRAQLSAIVLHNIGNAVTPVDIFLKQVKRLMLNDTGRYLGQCYDDLLAHRNNFNEYILKDKRGTRVNELMKNIIHDLNHRTSEIETLFDKIEEGLAQISEILTLQNTYSPDKIGTKESFRLNQLVEDSLKFQQTNIDPGICIVRKLSESLPRLKMEKSKLLQVVVNLIKNSCDAIGGQPSDRKHTITITTFRQSHGIGLSISDTGGGIARGKENRLFEFGRSTKGASGFSLYYCKSFIEANNGTLVLNNTDKGTAAIIFFPVNTCKE